MFLKWSKKKIVAIIRRRRREKQALNSNHIQIHEGGLYLAANRFFGSWGKAVTAAGINYSKVLKVKLRSWSQATVASEIIRRHEAGLSIRGRDVCSEDPGLYKGANRNFGENGWMKARVFSGFDPVDPHPSKIWDRQSVIREIHRLRESGVALNPASLQDSPYYYIMQAGRKVYGRWSWAVRSAGLDYSSIRKARPPRWWTESRVLRHIQSLQKRGVRLSHNTIRKSHIALFSAAIARFGSWSQAVETAGIPYRSHCRVWSSKAWLRKMKEEEYLKTLERAQTYGKKRRTNE